MTTVIAGNLEELGFLEIEPGLIEDSVENKKRLRRLEGDWQYERVLDENGQPTTGLIRPLTPAMLTERRVKAHETYRDLLEKPDDPWSDYVGPDDFPLDSLAPDWVLYRVQQWRYWEREGQEPKKPFPIRCEARRHDGTRCWSWASNPAEARVCRAHLKGTALDAARNAEIARIKVYEGSVEAADALIDLVQHAESDAVRLKASTEILDRSGIRAGTDINLTADVQISNPADEVQQRILTLAERLHRKQQQELEDSTEHPEPLAIQAEVIKETRDDE